MVMNRMPLVLYTILFDRKLKIREIKIVKRAGYNNSKYNYDKLIKKNTPIH